MRRIFKYDLSENGLEDVVQIVVPGPETFKPIAVHAQGGHLMLWGECDEERPAGPYYLLVRGTGHPLGAVGRHVGTAIVTPYVWHVYEAPKQ